MRTLVFGLLLLGLGGDVFAESPAPPQPEASIDMDAWESQVLGSIFGMYCGYYPDRLTIGGKTVGLTSYKQCAQLFAQFGPSCVNKVKAEGKWRVSSSEQGTILGTRLGACIDDQYAARLKQQQTKKR